ncbi:MAG: tetrathionate reductase family octaheme c-type cytochrome [Thiobacillus sp.]|nr:tetrathionate reductase family octaheme c-type cytochrome [Thiobacillus sp.]
MLISILRRSALAVGLFIFAGAGFPGVAVAADSVDHSRFKVLRKPFKSGQEVTRACIGCHSDEVEQVMKTKHWTWEAMNPHFDQKLGKKTVVNNFCIGIASNQPYCTSCHIGFGWKDNSFDFTAQENVDCLVCHDTTGTYRKPPGLAGHPVYEEMEFPPGSGTILRPVDLNKVAQNVGKTSRYSCIACHSYGGGGDGVKHGDLDSSLQVPDADTDVHMDALGLDFACAKCHAATGHDVPGSRYAPTVTRRGAPPQSGVPEKRNPAICESCHGSRPHSVDTVAKIKPLPGFTTVAMAAMVNNHADKLACQTCHIPAMARGGVPTKMSWDWSVAGRMGPDGKPIEEFDAKGHKIYDSKKGAFVLGENVVPAYFWFNGEVKYTLLGDKVTKGSGYTPINQFGGSPTDGKSRIWPVKRYRGVQPYDPVNQTLIVPHTYGTDPDAYSVSFNWEKAAAAGMASAGAPFSGKVDFIRTEMLWPLNHMVAPRANTLTCNDCHNPRNGSLSEGRMKNVPGLKKGPLFKSGR